MLVADAGDDASAPRHRDRQGTPSDIAWQYGVTGQAGDGAGLLEEPNFGAPAAATATRSSPTHGNARVLRVSAAGTIDREYDMKAARQAAWARGERPIRRPGRRCTHGDGLLVVADSVFQQIVLLGYEGSAPATSTPLDCGQPGVNKAFVSLTWQGDTGDVGHQGRPSTTGWTARRMAAVHVQGRAATVRLQGGDAWARPSPTG